MKQSPVSNSPSTEPGKGSKPSGIATPSTALLATQRRLEHLRTQTRIEQSRDEPTSAGESLRSQMYRYPIHLPTSEDDGPIQSKRLWRAANIPDRHAASIDIEGNPPAKWTKARDRVVSQLGKGFLIGLIGPRGTGKTQIAVQACAMNVRINRPALYVKAMDVFLWCRRAFSNDSTLAEYDLIGDFLCPRLLVIDEISVRGDKPWEDNLIVHLIDKRYDAMHDTILIANLERKEFRDSVGPSIDNRMIECGGAITCDWPSFRSKSVAREEAK